MRISAVFAVARLSVCLSVCLSVHLSLRLSVRLSVTLVYCIHTAEYIVNILSQHGSPIILVFDHQRRYPIPRGSPSAGAQNTWWVGKVCDFLLKSPFISETVRDRPMVAMKR